MARPSQHHFMFFLCGVYIYTFCLLDKDNDCVVQVPKMACCRKYISVSWIPALHSFCISSWLLNIWNYWCHRCSLCKIKSPDISLNRTSKLIGKPADGMIYVLTCFTLLLPPLGGGRGWKCYCFEFYFSSGLELSRIGHLWSNPSAPY